MPTDISWTRLPQKPPSAPLSFPFALRARAANTKRAPLRPAAALFVESLDFEAASELAEPWRHLAARALEPNVFAEPACALAAAQHFADVHRPRFLFVWVGNGIGERGDLLAVCPVHVPRRLESRRLAMVWAHHQAPLATPLLDRERATAALETILGFVHDALSPACGMVFRGLPRRGATARLLLDLSRARDLGCDISASTVPGRREPGTLPVAAPAQHVAAAFAAQRGDLERLGEVTFRSLHHPSDVRYATEEFFALDATACQGGGGAILGRSDVTTFVRAVTRMLAASGQCRIDRLAVGDDAIAMNIVIVGGDRDFVWKQASHPAHRVLEPAGQLLLAQTRQAPQAPALALADARMDAGARMWTGALPVVDIALATRPERSGRLVTAVRQRSGWQKLRSALGHHR